MRGTARVSKLISCHLDLASPGRKGAWPFCAPLLRPTSHKITPISYIVQIYTWNIWWFIRFLLSLHHQNIVELKNNGMNNNSSTIWLTNVKLLFNGKDYFIILCRLNNCLVPLPHQKRSLTCWTKGINTSCSAQETSLWRQLSELKNY